MALFTHAPSRQECGEKILKGDVRLGQEYNSRHGAVAWRHLACIGPRGQLIGSDHMTDREADALLYYPLPSHVLYHMRTFVHTCSVCLIMELPNHDLDI